MTVATCASFKTVTFTSPMNRGLKDETVLDVQIGVDGYIYFPDE